MYDLILSGIRSSYAENHLGDFFYSTVLAHRPKLAVELGSFMGYSSLHIAAALRDNKDAESELHLIDLWDQYTYRHCSLETIVQNFKKNGLLSLPHCKCSFINENAFEADSNYSASSVDYEVVTIQPFPSLTFARKVK